MKRRKNLHLKIMNKLAVQNLNKENKISIKTSIVKITKIRLKSKIKMNNLKSKPKMDKNNKNNLTMIFQSS
jgi:hypothetical protein